MADEMTDKEKMEFVFRIHDEEADVENWNREVAADLARKEDLELSEERWEMVNFLRTYFEEYGAIEYARDLSALLDQRYKNQGGLKHLFTLFPKGPVSQGCKIAGIPIPKGSQDASFGNVS